MGYGLRLLYELGESDLLWSQLTTDNGQLTMSLRSDIELVAPAGEADACYAALQYGADAVYLGLPRFSARADAVNIAPDALGSIIAYAHSLVPRRRVYVTVNTLVLENELPEAVEMLVRVADLGADAVIVQDLGIARILRERLPGLRLHASTQMAIHNLAGAQTLASMGFKRVVLARELMLEEVRDIAANAGIETEVFIHGALCFSYSGLCLFSSFFRGRSGNRGRCAQPCRVFCKLEEPGLKDGYAFSMKDLALGESVFELRKAGVNALKIEGRMKSPLYVATVVDYYRRLLDGKLSAGTAEELRQHMRTVFARPWTKLYFDSRGARDVADCDTAGHRGVPIGKVTAVRKMSHGRYALRLTTQRRIEKRDGLQIDIPGRGRPFGFSVRDLRLMDASGKRDAKAVIEAPAGSVVEVVLPPEHADIPVGAPVYCASSQEVKRKYRFKRPKPGEYGPRRAMNVTVTVHEDCLEAAAEMTGSAALRVAVSIPGAFAAARDAALTETAAKSAFGKLGDTALVCERFECHNPGGLFVPVSRFNELRRRLSAEVESQLGQALQTRVSEAVAQLQGGWARCLPRRSSLPRAKSGPQRAAAGWDSRPYPSSREAEALLFEAVQAGSERWAVLVDRVGSLSEFEASDWAGLDEIIVEIRRDATVDLEKGLVALETAVGRDRIRLALPVIARAADWQELCRRTKRFLGGGWTRWQVSNLYGSQMLDPEKALDISADWPLYVANRQAALELENLGINRFTLSPDDARENMERLLREFGARCTVIVYQDTPLFISATCARANLAGGKCAKCGHTAAPLHMEAGAGERIIALSDGCGTVVIPETPFSQADRLDDLRGAGASAFRADFIWRAYAPEEVRSTWRATRGKESE